MALPETSRALPFDGCYGGNPVAIARYLATLVATVQVTSARRVGKNA
jgi:hypothetical protein